MGGVLFLCPLHSQEGMELEFAPGPQAWRHVLFVTLLCRLPAWASDGRLISLVSEGPDMRTSAALCRAGDLLLMEAIVWHLPLPLAVSCSLGAWQ